MGGADKQLDAQDFADAREYEPVELTKPEGVVYAQSVGLKLGQKLLERAATDEGGVDFSLVWDDLVLYGIVREDGTRVFEDKEQVENLPLQPSMKMATAVLRASGLTRGAEEEAQEKSEGGPSGVSSTSSPKSLASGT